MDVPNNQLWFGVVNALQNHYLRGLKWISALKLTHELMDSLHGQGVDESEIIQRINDGHFDAYNCFDWLESVGAVSPEDSGQVDQKNRHGEYIDASDRRKILPGVMNLQMPMLGNASAPNAGDNPWKLARDQNSKITVSDQMLTLFKDDDSIVDRKALSKEVGKILGCTDSAVRLADPAWNFYRTEQSRRKKIRQDLKSKRWVESDDNNTDD
jgi:hypothetical protein